MALTSITPPPLPTFTTGIVVGAGDLNAIGANQTYLNGIDQTLNWPFERTPDGYLRYPFHRYRYLHWKTTATSSAQLLINGINAGAVAATSTSGAVDLQNSFNQYIGNPYGLILHRPYVVEWVGAEVRCEYLAEHAEANGVLTLPNANTSFSSGQQVTAAQLNNVAGNTKYLVENAGMLPSGGFAGRTYDIVEGDNNIRWRMWRRHRFLHCRLRFSSIDSSGQSNFLRLFVNDRRCFVDNVQGGATHDWDFCVDLNNGGQNFKFSGNGGHDFSDGALIAPQYDWYEIRLLATDKGGTPSRLYTVLLCESTTATRL